MSTRTRIQKLAAQRTSRPSSSLLLFAVFSLLLPLVQLSHAREPLVVVDPRDVVIPLEDIEEEAPEDIEMIEDITRAELNELLKTRDWSGSGCLDVMVQEGDLTVTRKDLFGNRTDWAVLSRCKVWEIYDWEDGEVHREAGVMYVPEEHPPTALKDALCLLEKVSPAQPKAKLAEAAVRRLGAEDCRTRKRAHEELKKIGLPALCALMRAKRSPDPEVRMRAKAIMPQHIDWILGTEITPLWKRFGRKEDASSETLSEMLSLYPLVEEFRFQKPNYFDALCRVTVHLGVKGVRQLADSANTKIQREVLTRAARMARNEKSRGGALPVITEALALVDLETRLQILWAYAPPKPKYVPVEPRNIGPFFPDKEIEKRVRAGEPPEPEEW